MRIFRRTVAVSVLVLPIAAATVGAATATREAPTAALPTRDLVTSAGRARQEAVADLSAIDLSSLAWMAGSWEGEAGGVEMEEHWTAPKGGVMLGLHRDVRPERPAFFEFLRIVETEDGVTYLASPMGREPTPFSLVEASGTRVVFENPEHDFPQRISYELSEDGWLVSRIEGLVDGELRGSEWRWQRVERRGY